MTNIKRLLQLKRHNKARGQGFDFESKILRDGNNHQRIVDDFPFICFEHWFVAACGTSVHSICTRNYAEEMDEEIQYDKKPCRVCDIVRNAWDIWNDPEKYSEEEVFQAGVICGKQKDKAKGWEAGWGAKLFAYYNVIDRDDDWCEENNHTKCLSKAESQSGITAGDGGILDEIIDVAEEYGDLEEFDIRIKKSGKKRDTSYRAYKAKEFDLTDDEKGYEKYDFSTKIKPATDETLKKWLEEGVKKKKTDAGDTEEEKPKKKMTSKKKAAKKIKKEVEPEEETETETDEAEEAEVEEKPAKKEKKKEKEKENKKVTKLKSKKKKDPEPEKEKETEEKPELAECPECDAMIPVDSVKCENCGEEFDGFED